MMRQGSMWAVVMALAASALARDFSGPPPVTRWMDPEGRPKPLHAVPADSGPLSLSDLSAPQALLAGEGTNRLCLVVHSNVLSEISSELDRFQDDLRADGFAPLLYRYDSGSAVNLRSYLAGLHAGEGSLEGAILIGNIPYIVYEMTNRFQDSCVPEDFEDFPCDVFYMDLNGSWTDSNSNGKYDTHSGDKAVEIWVARMRASNLDNLGWEHDLLKAYFDKNHAYRSGRLRPDRRALVYVDDDWAAYSGSTDAENLSRLYGDGHAIGVVDLDRTLASDYLSRMTNRYELMFVRSHGYPLGHSFNDGAGVYEYVYSADYRARTPPALFHSLFVCSGSDYSEYGYLAGTITFNHTNSGLACWGSTKTGGMLDDVYFYQELAAGQPLGRAFKTWYNTLQAYNACWFGSWFYGMIIIGDGSLRLNRTDPAPTNFTVAAGVAATQWAAIQGGRYRLQGNDDLRRPAWSNVSGVVTAAGYAISVADSLATPPGRVYRLAQDLSWPSNLLRNFSFEQPVSTDSRARYWLGGTPDGLGGIWGNAARVNWRAHGGEWEAAVRTDWGGTYQNFGGWWQEAAVTPGTTYQASAWFWADNTWSATEQDFKVEFYNGGSCISTSRVTLADVRESWTQKVITATAPALATSAHVVVSVSGAGANGALQFDEVEFRRRP